MYVASCQHGPVCEKNGRPGHACTHCHCWGQLDFWGQPASNPNPSRPQRLASKLAQALNCDHYASTLGCACLLHVAHIVGLFSSLNSSMEVPMPNNENGLGRASTTSVNTNKVQESGPLQTGGFSFPGTASGRPSNYHMMISNVQTPPPPTRSGAPSSVQVSSANAFRCAWEISCLKHYQALAAGIPFPISARAVLFGCADLQRRPVWRLQP